MTRALPTPDQIKELVCLKSGVLHWRDLPRWYFVREGNWRRWGARLSNRPVTVRLTNYGYFRVRIMGRDIELHRVIWLLHTNAWPAGEIDHINGKITDNRIENLRDVSKSINQRNAKLRKDNRSGCPGVYYSNTYKRWRAVIRLGNGKSKHLGSYLAVEDAIAARKRAQRGLGFTARHGEAA